MKSSMRLVGFVLASALLVWIGRATGPDSTTHEHEDHSEAAATGEAEIWTCPMHAQIRMPSLGDCPICGMDLVELVAGDDPGPRRMAMSPDAVRLAELRTSEVERRFVTRRVRMVGKLALDETAVKTISAWVPGRLERLFVDYTGVDVGEGEHLFELYSPALLTAQEELLSARDRVEATADDASEFLRESSARSLRAAHEKLALLGLGEDQIASVLDRGLAIDRLTINSPAAGTVIRRHRAQGDYVQTGTPVYDIADLGRLWVQLQAYEQDLTWVRFGQEVTFQAEALPGETFSGTVSFLDPVVDEVTRTVNLRVNIANPDGRLKPGMFVHAIVHAELGEGGGVVPANLAGKWVSPMHPEIIKDEPGTCDVCGMALVPAEELALVGALASPKAALVVPASAVLITGKRAVVYVEVPQTERPTYEGREVALGPRAGDSYVVRDGLTEGERVVTNGAFRIDSSMQIRAKPSMLSMPADSPGVGPRGEPFRASLRPVYDAYLDLGAALAADDKGAAASSASALQTALSEVRPEVLPQGARLRWAADESGVALAVAGFLEAQDIVSQRIAFEPLSGAMLKLASTYGVPGDDVWYEAFCPMALDGVGAAWIQRTETIANPYFGAAMLRCGEVRRSFVGAHAVPAEPVKEHAGHAHEPSSLDDSDAGLADAYLAIQQALAADRQASEAELEAMREAARGVPELEQASGSISGDLDAQRVAFAVLSEAMLTHVEAGNRAGRTLHEVHCPMAFDFEGASWLSSEATVLNPYFGSEMLTCGRVERAFEVQKR